MAGMEQKKSVAIVGAGLSGLCSLKECLAEGLEAVAFDTRDVIGGNWAYTGSEEFSPMYNGLILNSCRDTTSFTDFPLDPARYPDYFSLRLFWQYLNEYADHFGLRPHVQLRTRVLSCVPNEDSVDGSWTVRTQRVSEDGVEGKVEERVFSAVIAATGHATTPNMPDIEGQADFEAEFIHSNQYKSPGPYEGKKVVIIGLGSSAIDIACEIGPQAKELHMITRRGGWVLPRYAWGKPLEHLDSRASQLWVPHSLSQWVETKLLHFIDGPQPEVLRPSHKIREQNVSIRGDFTEKIRTGVITVQRAGIDRLTAHGLLLSNGVTLDNVDAVIAATGYKVFDLPYLPADTLRSAEEGTPDHAADLYRLTASPRYRNLFAAGFVDPFGPLPPVSEAQARFIAAAVSGRFPLPSAEKMRREVAAFHAMQAKNFVRSERHTLAGFMANTIDSLLEPLGAAPTFPRLLGRVFTGNPWTALKIINAVWFGVPTSAMWRLCGYGSTPELARETVLRVAGEKAQLSKREVELLHHKKEPKKE